ncbi:MAG: hypothetical protein WC429_05930, partial [Verrucomicrobiia bacterium]
MLTHDEKRVVRVTMWQLLAARLVAGVTLVIVARQSGLLTGALMQSSPWLTAFCVFVGLTLLNVPLEYYRNYWAEVLRERLSKLFQFRVFEYMQAQSVDFFMGRNPGALMRQ